jgi:hypothetical protein
MFVDSCKAGLDNIALDDNETTYQQLIDRVQKTVDALKTAKPENFAGKEDNEVSLFNGKFTFTAVSYLQVFGELSRVRNTAKRLLIMPGLPNFFFHVTTAYNILRKEGVPVGKLDFLGRSM